MTVFSYRALDASGGRISGTIEAETTRHARSKLRDRGLFPQHVIDTHQPKAAAESVRLRLSLSRLALLTRNLASLLCAGLTLESALSATFDQSESKAEQRIISRVRADVVSGLSLAEAMGSYPGVFPAIYRALIRAGEHSGGLDEILTRLADYLEDGLAMRTRMIQAFLYPGIVSLVALLVITSMMSYVVPKVVTAFHHGKQTLPLLTRALIWTSDALALGLPWIFGVVLLALGLFAWSMRHHHFRTKVHQALLGIPLIGKLVRTSDSARFAQTLSILVSGGVPLLGAMDSAKQVLAMLPLQQAVSDARMRVEQGASLAVAIGGTKQFPPLLIHLIASGERSGTLPVMLERAAKQQRDELSNQAALVAGMLEPALIVAMGGIVLVIVLAILQPIIELNQLLK